MYRRIKGILEYIFRRRSDEIPSPVSEENDNSLIYEDKLKITSTGEFFLKESAIPKLEESMPGITKDIGKWLREKGLS